MDTIAIINHKCQSVVLELSTAQTRLHLTTTHISKIVCINKIANINCICKKSQLQIASVNLSRVYCQLHQEDWLWQQLLLAKLYVAIKLQIQFASLKIANTICIFKNRNYKSQVSTCRAWMVSCETLRYFSSPRILKSGELTLDEKSL